MRSNLSEWNKFIDDHPEAHLLQTGNWGELKTSFGWKAERVIGKNCGAQNSVPFDSWWLFSGIYSQGAGGENWIDLLPEIDSLCAEKKAIFLKVEPDLWEEKEGLPFFQEKRWKRSHPIQPRRTIFIPITEDEEQILASMKQKTRYNIHLAEKKG